MKKIFLMLIVFIICLIFTITYKPAVQNIINDCPEGQVMMGTVSSDGFTFEKCEIQLEQSEFSFMNEAEAGCTWYFTGGRWFRFCWF
jgi:hypothetical protein